MNLTSLVVELLAGASDLDPWTSVSISAFYQKELIPADVHARSGRSGADLERRFRASICPLTAAEAETLREAARQLSSRLARAFPRLLRALPKRLRIAKLCQASPHDNHAYPENGFPHTHGRIIFLPAPSLREKPQDLARLLLHEQLHVLQRARPALARQMYARSLSLRPVLRRRLLYEREGVQTRANPDLDAYLYGKVVHGKDDKQGVVQCQVQVYNSPKPKNLSDSRVKAVLVSGKPSYFSPDDLLSPGNSLKVSIASTSTDSYEHPNEAVAYMLAEAVFPHNPQIGHRDTGTGIIAETREAEARRRLLAYVKTEL